MMLTALWSIMCICSAEEHCASPFLLVPQIPRTELLCYSSALWTSPKLGNKEKIANKWKTHSVFAFQSWIADPSHTPNPHKKKKNARLASALVSLMFRRFTIRWSRRQQDRRTCFTVSALLWRILEMFLGIFLILLQHIFLYKSINSVLIYNTNVGKKNPCWNNMLSGISRIMITFLRCFRLFYRLYFTFCGPATTKGSLNKT